MGRADSPSVSAANSYLSPSYNSNPLYLSSHEETGDQAITAAEESMQWRQLSRPKAFSLAVQVVGQFRSNDNSVDRACQVGAELATITGQIASDRVKVRSSSSDLGMHMRLKTF